MVSSEKYVVFTKPFLFSGELSDVSIVASTLNCTHLHGFSIIYISKHRI